MQKTAVAFLGGGRITSAILAGLKLATHDYRLVVHDRNPQKLRRLKTLFAVTVEDDLGRAVANSQVLVVAVRPASVPGLLENLEKFHANQEKPGQITTPLAISLAAGIPLKTLAGLCGSCRWARAMPSPVGRFGRGLTALTFHRSFPRRERKRIRDLFSLIGRVVELPEAKLDAFTVIYSSSHGYHALASLAESAEAVGLDRKTALLASSHALADGIIAWREGHVSLPDLLEEAATPGGIAAATMAAMDKSGYKRSVKSGVTAGLRRARANATK